MDLFEALLSTGGGGASSVGTIRGTRLWDVWGTGRCRIVEGGRPQRGGGAALLSGAPRRFCLS